MLVTAIIILILACVAFPTLMGLLVRWIFFAVIFVGLSMLLGGVG